MDSSKHSASNMSDKKNFQRRTYVKRSGSEVKKNKNDGTKEGGVQKRRFNPVSMIPRLKKDKYREAKKMQITSISSPKIVDSFSSAEVPKDDYESKLKLLEAKERSIANYYAKIEDLVQKMMIEKKKNSTKEETRKDLKEKSQTARKMTSDPLVFSKTSPQKSNLSICDLEDNVRQISEIWMKTSTDLTNTLNNLKNNPRLDSIEFQVESMKIQIALKQAKSLTLIQTRNVIEEAKKLMQDRQVIRDELQSIVTKNSLDRGQSQNKNSLQPKSGFTDVGNQKGQIGDSKPKNDSSSDEPELSTSLTEESLLDEMKELSTDLSVSSINSGSKSKQNEDTQSGRTNLPGKLPKKSPNQSTVPKEYGTLEAELTKKNETITFLNSRIFELQKTCNETISKYNQLQVKLLYSREKIQWNQLLWKQIGKLKNQIKGLQQSNSQLESQKRELETKILKLDCELDKIINLNKLLNKRKRSKSEKLPELETGSGEDVNTSSSKQSFLDDLEKQSEINERIVTEKHSVIEQLKKILDIMKDQENTAQKQIVAFQSKIEELEKTAND